MKAGAFAVLIAVIYLAALFVLVRPNSQGPKLIGAVSSGLQGLIGSATGGGTWGK